jgi:hypothetical protein
MTMILQDRGNGARSSVSPAQRLRESCAAVRVSFTWFGVRKALTNEQKSQAAEPFGAEGEYLSACKKLLDTKHEAFKAVTAVRGKVRAHWKSLTLPFPEPGMRLIRQEEVEGFNQQMGGYRDELGMAVRELEGHYTELQRTASRRLGNLFNPSDYPPSLVGLFDVEWDFPNVEPPEYLRQLNPAIYEQERQRVVSRFDEAVRLAEQAFISELAKLIEHLTERLSQNGDGEPKIFRDTAITNLTEFFQRFRQLNVRSNADLDALVERAQGIVNGVQPQALRDNDSLRQHIATQLSQVQSVIDGMLVDRPRRSIIRARPGEGANHGAGH